METPETLRVGAGMLFNAQGEVLLGLRPEGKKRGGLWEMPGGKVEGTEPPRVAVVREWQEELGVTVTAHDRIAIAHLDLEVKFDVYLFEVRLVDPAAVLRVCDHTELRWTDLERAVTYMPCSPALYLHYPEIREWMTSRSPNGR